MNGDEIRTTIVLMLRLILKYDKLRDVTIIHKNRDTFIYKQIIMTKSKPIIVGKQM